MRRSALPLEYRSRLQNMLGLALLSCLSFLWIGTANAEDHPPLNAPQIATPPALSDVEQQQRLSACATHAGHMLEQAKTIDPQQTQLINQQLMLTLDTLIRCRHQDAQAMQERIKATIGKPPKYKEL